MALLCTHQCLFPLPSHQPSSSSHFRPPTFTVSPMGSLLAPKVIRQSLYQCLLGEPGNVYLMAFPALSWDISPTPQHFPLSQTKQFSDIPVYYLSLPSDMNCSWYFILSHFPRTCLSHKLLMNGPMIPESPCKFGLFDTVIY